MSDDKSRPESDQETTGQATEERPEAAPGEEETPEDATTEAAPDVVADAEARAERNWNEYLRARAELDNLRKRAARDVEQAHRFAIERFVTDLLPVRDSLEQGLAAAREVGGDAGEKLIEGKELTLKMLDKVLAEHGVEAIDPEGERFDPNHHEAMTTQPSAERDPDTVLLVLQKGFMLNGRLVRPARVVVSREADDDADA